MRRLRIGILMGLVITTGIFGNQPTYAKDKPATDDQHTVQAQAVAVEVAGVKFWLPSQLFAKKGDKVRLHLVSKVPGIGNVHGYAIEAFKIAEVVDEKGKDIEFVADKAGIFPIKCHLHPAHVGGQLVVLD